MPNNKEENKENKRNKLTVNVNGGNSKNSGKPAKGKRKSFKLKPNEVIDYKQVDILLSFSTENGKIKSRRSTHLTLKQQRQLSKSIKRARYLRLLPFVTSVEN